MLTQEVTVKLVKVTCCNCGCVFGMDERTHWDRKRDHGGFYCPNGHWQHYPQESNEEKARRERDKALQKAARHREQAEHFREQKNHAERSRAAIKGHYTRMKKRIANGVCPCCGRSFTNVRRHMQTKHPDVLQKLKQHERGSDDD